MFPRIPSPLPRTLLLGLIGIGVLTLALMLSVGWMITKPSTQGGDLAMHVPADRVRVLLRAPDTPSLTKLMEHAAAFGIPTPPEQALDDMNPTEFALLDTGSGAMGWVLYAKEARGESASRRDRIVSENRATADLVSTTKSGNAKRLSQDPAYASWNQAHPFGLYLRTDALTLGSLPMDLIMKGLLANYTSVSGSWSSQGGSLRMVKKEVMSSDRPSPLTLTQMPTGSFLTIAAARPREAYRSLRQAITRASPELEEGMAGIAARWVLDAGLDAAAFTHVLDAPASLAIVHGSGGYGFVLSLRGNSSDAEMLIASLSSVQPNVNVRHFDFFGENVRTDIVRDDSSAMQKNVQGEWTTATIERASPMPPLTIAYGKNDIYVSNEASLVSAIIARPHVSVARIAKRSPSLMAEWQGEELQSAMRDALPFLVDSSPTSSLVSQIAKDITQAEVVTGFTEDVIEWLNAGMIGE